MKPHFFIGIDRSDFRLDLCILNANGEILEQSSISTDPEAMLAWARKIEAILPAGARAALCIEQPCPGLLNFFRQFGFLALHLINPLTLKHYREAFNTSRAKDDKKDAFHLARLILEKHDLLKAWEPDDAQTRQLAILTQKRRQLVWELQRAALDAPMRFWTGLTVSAVGAWPQVKNLPDQQSVFSNTFLQHRVWLEQ